MPDMRDAIAQYLAFTGGRMPQGGFPGMGGQTLALPPGGGGPGVMVDQPPYGGAPPIGGGGMPPVPSNLQGYPQLPSGQFLPTQMPPGATDPWQGGGPSIGPQRPPGGPPPQPYGGSDIPGPGVPQVPPLNTPMQAPLMPPGPPSPVGEGSPFHDVGRGQPAPEMDPSVWERMYGSGR